MSHYCPKCLAEYRDDIPTCPRDKSRLTKTKPASYERLVDFYAASDEMEAEHLISLLAEENIIARESPTGISQLPVASDTHFVIAVLREDLARAKAFVEQARRDEVISAKGSFC